MSEEIDFNKMGDNHEKRVFKIKVGDLSPEDAKEYLKLLMKSYKEPSGKFINPDYKIP